MLFIMPSNYFAYNGNMCQKAMFLRSIPGEGWRVIATKKNILALDSATWVKLISKCLYYFNVSLCKVSFSQTLITCLGSLRNKSLKIIDSGDITSNMG